jgi:hypothetical protein
MLLACQFGLRRQKPRCRFIGSVMAGRGAGGEDAALADFPQGMLEGVDYDTSIA